MLSPLTNQEAVLSSKIEGAQATVDEVLEYEAEKIRDIQEIVNYRMDTDKTPCAWRKRFRHAQITL